MGTVRIQEQKQWIVVDRH